MTIKELISQLQLLDPELKVVVRGYESGYNDILKLERVKINRVQNTTEWDGEYNTTKDADAIDAINLFGENLNATDTSSTSFLEAWTNIEGKDQFTINVENQEYNVKPLEQVDHILYEVYDASNNLLCALGLNEHAQWEANNEYDENKVREFGNAIEQKTY